MFAALRGVSDALTPDGTDETDDELWQASKEGDKSVAEGNEFEHRDDFIRWRGRTQFMKDSSLTQELAQKILKKSVEINHRVDTEIPGMHRTRAEQMEEIERLIKENNEVTQSLESAYSVLEDKRNECRQFIQEKTGEALGIEEM